MDVLRLLLLETAKRSTLRVTQGIDQPHFVHRHRHLHLLRACSHHLSHRPAGDLKYLTSAFLHQSHPHHSRKRIHDLQCHHRQEVGATPP